MSVMMQDTCPCGIISFGLVQSSHIWYKVGYPMILYTNS
jgi:hypothetical protein